MGNASRGRPARGSGRLGLLTLDVRMMRVVVFRREGRCQLRDDEADHAESRTAREGSLRIEGQSMFQEALVRRRGEVLHECHIGVTYIY